MADPGRLFRITGLVQGVGFRPYAAGLAEELGLSGYVRNTSGIVTLYLKGDPEAVEELIHRLSLLRGDSTELPGASVERIEELSAGAEEALPDFARASNPAEPSGLRAVRAAAHLSGFHIVESDQADGKALLFPPPDIGLCESCRAELEDPGNRRFRHPLISCASCGPRYTIMRALPYDRVRTTMSVHPMCPECEEEYRGETPDARNDPETFLTARSDPKGRRRHAQTISCLHCGPQVWARIPGAGVSEHADKGTPERAKPESLHEAAARSETQEAPGEPTVPSEMPGAPDGAAARNEMHEVPDAATAKNRSYEFSGKEALDAAISCLKADGLIAIKGIGGYHLSCLALGKEGISRLRHLKIRERKAFAVMFPDIESIRENAFCSEAEERLLTSSARPIVLLNAKPRNRIALSTSAWGVELGAMLPASGLEELILGKTGPLIMTSANAGGEPMLFQDEEMIAFAGEHGLDLVLGYDREILRPLDDSVCRIIEPEGAAELQPAERGPQEQEAPDGDPAAGKRPIVQLIRRARGYVPAPIRLPIALKQPCFAAGGDLKAVFGLGVRDAAYLSGHYGDLEDVRAYSAWQQGIAQLKELLGIAPEVFLADKHPGYYSAASPAAATAFPGQNETEAAATFPGQSETKAALTAFPGQYETPAASAASLCQHKSGFARTAIQAEHRADVERIQHHHAHILSVMAEHGLTGKTIGLAFDGTGFGEDGSIWGGELLICEGHRMKRAGCLFPVFLPKQDEAAREGKLCAAAYLAEAEKQGYLEEDSLLREDVLHRIPGYSLYREGLKKAPERFIPCSSMGRLFDAAAYLLGISSRNTYEGESAMALQYAAEKGERCDAEVAAMDFPVEWISDAELHETAESRRMQEPHEAVERRNIQKSCGLTEWSNMQEPCEPVERKSMQEPCESAERRKNQNLSEPSELKSMPDKREGLWLVNTPRGLMELYQRSRMGESPEALAYAFHLGLARVSRALCELAADPEDKGKDGGTLPVALSGGCMNNRLLLKLLLRELNAAGFTCYINEKVPCGDGGLALGQLWWKAIRGDEG